MSFVFNGPVPGQSLTSEPKGFAFERPADIVDPLEALDLHIDNMSKPESIEDALFFLETGLDLVTLVEGILRSAVMEGIHSLDISLIIAPVLHEHERNTIRAKKMLKQLSKKEDIEVEKEPEVEVEEIPEVETTETPPPTQGLMSRVMS